MCLSEGSGYKNYSRVVYSIKAVAPKIHASVIKPSFFPINLYPLSLLSTMAALKAPGTKPGPALKFPVVAKSILM